MKKFFSQGFTRLSTLKYDIPSGLVVFLIALPLCLGIALASGAPLFSGIITGIIGGVVVSQLSGSSLSVSGPAAGLTVIVFAAIQSLGFQPFLCAVVLAGAMQLILGYARAGTIGLYFPSSVIKGMLAAIGIILILKQIPHAFGYDKDYLGDFTFVQSDGENTFSELLKLFEAFDASILMISTVSFGVLLIWDKWIGKKIPLVPAPLVVVCLGILFNIILSNISPAMAIESQHMVQVPIATNIDEFLGLFINPDFNALSNPAVWTTAVTLALIASLETLLSVEAIDKLDPQKRNTPTNRELKAQGVGNILSGLIGGLPMTAVIVRGSANIAAGAKSKLSSFFHGLFMFACVLCIPTVLNKIPLSCLAVILIFIGYKLTKPALYRNMWKAGYDQFIPFIVTVLAIVFTDLLIGISVGLAVGIFNILRRNSINTYSFDRSEYHQEAPIRLILSEEVSFLNKASMLLTLEHLPHHSKVIIDGRKSKYIDYDVLEIIHDFTSTASTRDIEVELLGIKPIYKTSNH